MPFSECFGLHVSRDPSAVSVCVCLLVCALKTEKKNKKTQRAIPLDEATAKKAPDAFQKLTDSLAVYKAKLEERNEAKLRALREQLASESKASIEMARRDAEVLWAGIISNISMESGGGSSSVGGSSTAATKSGSISLASAATAPRSGTNVSGLTAKRKDSEPSSRETGGESAALWLMDEGQSGLFPFLSLFSQLYNRGGT